MSTTHCHKSTLMILTIAWVVTLSLSTSLHHTHAAVKRPRQKRATVTRRAAAPMVTPPVALVQQQPLDYLSGEASVQVRGNRTPIVRLGMAQHGVTIIEFPVSDRFFAIHPGDSEMVTVEDSPTKAKDRFMVLRAGSGFIAPSPTSVAQFSAAKQKKQPPHPLPATSIVVQMQSGLVLTFMIYPVPMLSQQAHRCVISYSRSEVIEARRSAGLAVNLDGTDPTAPVTTASPTTPLTVSLQTSTAAISTPVTRDVLSTPPVVAEIERRSKKLSGGLTDSSTVAKTALAQATTDPKQFKRWTKPLHGLAVSTVARELGEWSRLVIVAVRNQKSEAVQIMPGHPDIFIETMNEQGQPLQVEQIKKLHVETTTSSSVVPAGAIVYYALVFETPMLGAKQHLRVAVGQINATDEPATADVTSAK
ncbi:MAG: hypothetical protein M3R15_25095 [Acidobacteriota bacterium]|nr:hypothetical protein [Acidobacteriota bacterium]